MNKVNIPIHKGRKYLYYFDNISDLYKYISSNKPDNSSYMSSTECGNRMSWYGNITYDEAITKLNEGDIELANKIEDVDIGEEVKVEKITQEYINDICGIIPHVPNAIIGVPLSMINIKRTRVKTNNKIINLVLDSTVAFNVKEDSYCRVSKLILNIIDKLERLGYRCNLYYMIANSYDIEYQYSNQYINSWIIKLKNAGEPFNKYKCAFVLAHLAMFRRIGFRLIELTDNNRTDERDYGRVLYKHEANEVIKELLSCNGVNSDSIKIIRIFDILEDTEQDIISSIVDINQNEL